MLKGGVRTNSRYLIVFDELIENKMLLKRVTLFFSYSVRVCASKLTCYNSQRFEEITIMVNEITKIKHTGLSVINY